MRGPTTTARRRVPLAFALASALALALMVWPTWLLRWALLAL